ARRPPSGSPRTHARRGSGRAPATPYPAEPGRPRKRQPESQERRGVCWPPSGPGRTPTCSDTQERVRIRPPPPPPPRAPPPRLPPPISPPRRARPCRLLPRHRRAAGIPPGRRPGQGPPDARGPDGRDRPRQRLRRLPLLLLQQLPRPGQPPRGDRGGDRG